MYLHCIYRLAIDLTPIHKEYIHVYVYTCRLDLPYKVYTYVYTCTCTNIVYLQDTINCDYYF